MEGKLNVDGKLKPLGDRILVKLGNGKEDETKSGLIIPDSAKEKPLLGTVIDVGPGRTSNDGKVVPIDIKVGSRVYFGKYTGIEFELNGDKVLLLHEDEVYGVIESND